MSLKASALLIGLVAGCASQPKCVPVDGPLLSGDQPILRVTPTAETGVVRVRTTQRGGMRLRGAASITIRPDSGRALSVEDTVGVFRVSRPFRLFVRSVGYRAADTLIVLRPDAGAEIVVELPPLYGATPPLCIQR
jgi:hypothetical protein